MTEAPQKRAVKGEQVTYGTFEDVPPLADGGELRLHYVSVSLGFFSMPSFPSISRGCFAAFFFGG